MPPLVLFIISMASTVNRSSHPPGIAPFWVFPGGNCFYLRYLLSEESWRIALTQKTMEMDFWIVFCACPCSLNAALSLLHVIHSITFASWRKIANRIASQWTRLQPAVLVCRVILHACFISKLSEIKFLMIQTRFLEEYVHVYKQAVREDCFDVFR
jgi:hypothetical protein